MKITFARQPLAKSIFLAGPTPRASDVPSWRPTAFTILDEVHHFNGTVFVPEDADAFRLFDYDDQVAWEWEAINQSTVVVFWIPRELETMPAFTTNIEFGFLATSGKVVLGAPPDAPKMGYLNALAARYNIPVYDNLHDVLAEAVARTNQPFGQYQSLLLSNDGIV